MRKEIVGVMLAAVGLAGCVVVDASRDGGKPVAAESETIRYETGACFGACPVYTVTIAPDGKGTFEGQRFTAVTGTRSFQASPEAYHLFAAKLAPYRPQGERWTGGGAAPSHLNAYFGCDMEQNAAMFRALADAPRALPIGGFIGGGARPT
jgi:hypothetical protein